MKDKVLIIIPAYNEEENIEKVLKEIKRDIDFADILVINDHSKDNTEKVVRNNNIKCINNVFNMKYSMTIQTGIKYAYKNDYDYVIQMDADGQHIAKEALKLYKTIKKEKCNIVIGSRFIEKTDYPSPFFRRVGTKIFEIMIKLFTGKKIADPLSGFQCLDKKVIEAYANFDYYPDFPDANLILEMIYKGFSIKEVSVEMRTREMGTSIHAGIIKPIIYMIRQMYSCIVIFVKYVGKRVKK